MGCAVVIIDHAGNDVSKPRGTSGKRDDVDVVWKVSRSGDAVSLARTHTRKRHEVDRLNLRREVDPTRHVRRDGQKAGPDQEREEKIEAFVTIIGLIDPPPDLSLGVRGIGELVRTSGHSVQNDVLAMAWKRHKERLSE